ncbi:glycosyltransferase family 2 protein [Aestuariivirga sp.]|uniref:glycosyltransferase family 2 protein n=1 Tax=Aestuariivirga sp. TaxID=2650926 RepID=UPI003BACC4BB
MLSPPNLSIVVPCYNEAEVLPETIRQLERLLEQLAGQQRISSESRIFLVDDGSGDATWSLIAGAVEAGRPVVGVKLSRNRGHQIALIAGLEAADGDVVVSIDADLQDDLAAVGLMLAKFVDGADIVYGVRRKREADSLFKRSSARAFYRLMRMLGTETVPDHADFRLMSRRAVDALSEFREVNLYLRGMIPMLGFPSETVLYDRRERLAGVTKYPLRRMLALAIDAITSFSVLPLRLISGLGLLVSLTTTVLGIWTLLNALIHPAPVPGWASTVLPIYFLGGIQLVGIGIIGEYVGKLYLEAKNRPRYFIERIDRQKRNTFEPRMKSQQR